MLKMKVKLGKSFTVQCEKIYDNLYSPTSGSDVQLNKRLKFFSAALTNLTGPGSSNYESDMRNDP